MKRLLYALILTLLCAVAPAMARTTAKQAFVTAPRELFPTIDSLTRLDMIDYYESGSATPSKNRFGGGSRVSALSEDSITVETSPATTVTLYTLPSKGDTLLLAVTTMSLPAPDAMAALYTSKWEPLPPKAALPSHNQLKLWLLKCTKEQRQLVENLVPFIPASYSLRGNRLTITSTLDRLLPADDYQQVVPFLRSSISYSWDGQRWKLDKQ